METEFTWIDYVIIIWIGIFFVFTLIFALLHLSNRWLWAFVVFIVGYGYLMIKKASKVGKIK